MDDLLIKKRIDQLSKDYYCFNAIDSFITRLEGLDISYIVIGSCALQSYLPFYYRLPSDLDVVIPSSCIDKFTEHLASNGVDFQQQIGCYQVLTEHLSVHLMVGALYQVDKESGIKYGRISLELTNDQLTRQNITFVAHNKTKTITVPIPEIMFLLNMLGTLNTNNVYGLLELLDKLELDSNKIKCYMSANEIIRQICMHRIIQLRDIIIRHQNSLLIKINHIIKTLEKG